MPKTERRERPIIFAGEMVRAILDGRETMARRVCRLTDNGLLKMPDAAVRLRDGIGPVWSPYGGAPERPLPKEMLDSPYGKPGDLLWVRETWQSEKDMQVPDSSPIDVVYRATDEKGWIEFEFDWKWCPSIHMPRWASRITLEVVDVRVELNTYAEEWEWVVEFKLVEATA